MYVKKNQKTKIIKQISKHKAKHKAKHKSKNKSQPYSSLKSLINKPKTKKIVLSPMSQLTAQLSKTININKPATKTAEEKKAASKARALKSLGVTQSESHMETAETGRNARASTLHKRDILKKFDELVAHNKVAVSEMEDLFNKWGL